MGTLRARRVVEEDEAPVVASPSSDDEEANCDLSLEIVERAKRKEMQASVDKGFATAEEWVGEGRKLKNEKKGKKKKKKRANVEEISDAAELKGTKRKKNKGQTMEQYCEVLEGVEFEGNNKRKEGKTDETVEMKVAMDDAIEEGSKRKRRKNRKLGVGQQNEVVYENVELVESTEQKGVLLTVGKEDPAGSQDSSVTDLNESSDLDNAVLRKLLRIPRYFDTENTTWKATCFNCGEEGHHGPNCTAGKRKKPCFLCGEFGHNSNRCRRGLECFVCKNVGHTAKECTKKQKRGLQNLKICLQCGENGHEMTFCINDYSTEDLDQIQCYICGGNGHLCCSDAVGASSAALSCYNCGQTGHTGFGCAKPRWQVSSAESTTVCHLCGEGGHFARGCTKRAEFARRKKEASTPRREHHKDREFTVRQWDEGESIPGRKFDWDGQYTQSKSAPYIGKVDKKKNSTQDQRVKTARKARIKNGWRMVDEDGAISNKDFPNVRFSTPDHKLKFENRSYDPSSRKKQRYSLDVQRPLVSVNHY